MNAHTTPRAIDRDELARRLSNARAETMWSQREVAERVNVEGVSEGFISGLERGQIAFREPSMLTRTEALCKMLSVEIPWVSAMSQKSKALVVAKKQTQQVTDTESKIEDAEVTAIYLCNRALAKLTDQESTQRVITYLQSRYLKE